jgi:hypothetical protein
MPNIVIGIDEGSYSIGVGTKQVTLSGITTFVPTIDSLLYFFNTSQDIQYFAQAETYAKEVTITTSGSDYILEYQDLSTFPELISGDKIHIQFWVEGADFIDTNGYKGIVALAPGHVSTVNSTTDTLDPAEAFTGDWEDIVNFGVIVISLKANVSSATDGLMVQFSNDGTDAGIISDDEFTYSANAKKTFSFQAAAQYYRVTYTNGGTIQASFRLQTVLKPYYVKPSSHRIQDTISGQDDSELVKAAITGVDPDGDWQNVNTTVDGDLSISNNSSGLAIAKGDVTGTTFVHKFGNAPDFDTVDLEVTVWDGAEDGTTWELMNYIYSTSADIQYISSSDNGDTQSISIQGLDADYNLITQTKTLTGQTSATIDTPLIRVFRAFNDNSVDLSGHVFISTTTAPAGGVPTAANIRAIIDPTNQQTEMAVYTIPAGKTGYMRDWYIATAGGNKSSSYVFRLKSRLFGKVFRTKHTSAMDALAPIPYQHNYTEPEVFPEKTDIEMRVTSIASPASIENAVSAGFDIVLVDN